MRQRRVTGLDVAVLGTLGALFMLVRVLDAPGPDRFDSYPEPVAALLEQVTAKVPARGSSAAISRLFDDIGAIAPAVAALGADRPIAVEPLIALVDVDISNARSPQIPMNRLRAIYALAEIGPAAAAATPLLLAIADEPSEVAAFRQAALQAVVSIGHVPASDVPIVLGLLKDTADGELRKAAVDAIAVIGPSAAAAVPNLAALLRVDDPSLRISAANALAAIGPAADPAIPELIAALGDPRPMVRMTVAEALGSVGPAAAPATGALVGLLSVDQPMEPLLDQSLLEGEVGAVFESILAARGVDRESVREVLDLDGNPVWITLVRVRAAEALAKIGPAAADAIPALSAAMWDEEDAVRDAAAEALRAIRGG